ncbi:dienelactone hydrolase family protein [Opitutia bacterium ISCC 51]|nr:dienelactone hydrolase family protein [Opitutae bacterium ISCC 51]QXD29813.1 dienelactone hydrolase family protein [Opitutae bacterium ISCC 52]
MNTLLRTACLFSLLAASPLSIAEENSYDPLHTDNDISIETLDFVINDQDRDRDIPIKIYLPNSDEASTVVLFSHGLGGSKNNNSYLGNHWAKRGYVAVFMQHKGSDESVWKDEKLRNRMKAMRQAASLKNSKLRFEDVPVVIDALENWNENKDHSLHAKLDLKHLGMSGHSYGAVTTQAVSGQTAWGGRVNYTDERIKAAVAFSPSSPRGRNIKGAFEKVKVPWMLMTGTEDHSPIGNSTVESRLAVFPALPKGDKYELVLFNAEHSAFSERRLPGDKEKRNPNHHQAILALSTAFWDAYLKNDKEALAWLKSDEARSVLEEKDRWQRK